MTGLATAGALALTGPAAAQKIKLAAGVKEPRPPKPASKKALFVYGGWPGHEPEKCRDIFVPWFKKEGFDLVVSNDLTPYADKALMDSLDLVVQLFTQGAIEKDQLKGLTRAVRENGTGIAGWHGGLGDSFRTSTEYEYMIGGNWVSHPGGKIEYEVLITDRKDPITKGLKNFKLRTEQYFMNVNPNNKVLATTAFTAEHDPWIAGSTMPVAWKKMHGKGRVFYTSIGHSADVFDTPEALALTQRGILWASDSKYEDTPPLVVPMYPKR